MKTRMPQDQPKPSSKRKRLVGKGSLDKNQDAQAIRKKQRTQSPDAETTSTYMKLVKVTAHQRAKWQPLPNRTRMQLEAMMNSLISSLLSQNQQNKKEIEKHLRKLQERILKRFETLNLPVKKPSSVKGMKGFRTTEKEKLHATEEDLAQIQEEIDKAVQAAKLRDETIQSLQNKVRELKCELAAKEEAAAKIFQRDNNEVLALPKLSKDSLEAPMLQDCILKIPNQEGVLKDLNTIQQSAEMKTMLTFLKTAFEEGDSDTE